MRIWQNLYKKRLFILCVGACSIVIIFVKNSFTPNPSYNHLPILEYLPYDDATFIEEQIPTNSHAKNLPDNKDSYTNKTQFRIENLIPPCGEVCELRTDPNLSEYDFNTIDIANDDLISHGKPLLTKRFDCPSIISRMALNKGPKELSKPPAYPPDYLLPAFTMFGRLPIRLKLRYFSNNTYDPGQVRVIERKKFKKMAHNFLKGKKVGTYGHKVVSDFYRLLKKYRAMGYIKRSAKGETKELSKGLTIGSQRFWTEMLLLKIGIQSLITLEYANIKSEHPQIKVYYPHDLAQEILINMSFNGGDIEIAPMFDIGVSYSSLEHCGLGRYGEDLDPYGDLEAMAQAWCLMKPGGLFFLNVPFTPTKLGYIEWNAHRVYNWERILHMAANWVILEYTDYSNEPNLISKIFVLQKPYRTN